MNKDFWSFKHLMPDNWLELVYGIVMIGITIVALIIVVDLVIHEL